MGAIMPDEAPPNVNGELPELSREAIEAADDRPLVALDIPEWKGRVWIRPLSGEERDQYWNSLFVGDGPARTLEMKLARAKAAVLSCCKADGSLMFCDHDIEWLAKKASKPLERIYQLADRLSAISPGSLEDLVKN